MLLGHQGPTHRDIPDPGHGTSQTKTFGKAPLSVVFDTEWPGCSAIWVGMSRDLGAHLGYLHKILCARSFGLVFRPPTYESVQPLRGGCLPKFPTTHAHERPTGLMAPNNLRDAKHHSFAKHPWARPEDEHHKVRWGGEGQEDEWNDDVAGDEEDKQEEDNTEQDKELVYYKNDDECGASRCDFMACAQRGMALRA